MIRGSCLCGAVRFEMSGRPSTFSYCHCSRCRKSEGVFAAVLVGFAGAMLGLAVDDALEFCERDAHPLYTNSR